ncbi:MAG: hypothetical protein HY905_02975 [Deltaproteobacteria bacterium]|nr:hypothetical protein [Deltaproteobacteria bacterium]
MGKAKCGPGRSLVLALLAGAVGLLATGAASAQDVDDSGCYPDTQGTLICPVEVIGQARDLPQVVVNREPLGAGLADLRTSFLDEVETTVRDDPF